MNINVTNKNQITVNIKTFSNIYENNDKKMK